MVKIGNVLNVKLKIILEIVYQYTSNNSNYEAIITYEV